MSVCRDEERRSKVVLWFGSCNWAARFNEGLEAGKLLAQNGINQRRPHGRTVTQIATDYKILFQIDAVIALLDCPG